MKKKILALTAAAAALFSIGVNAQQNVNCPVNGNQNCQYTQCDNKDCKDPQNCRFNKDGKKYKAECMFEGLNLSQEQKDRIKAISTPRQTLKAGNKAGYDKGVNPRDYVRTVRADYLKQIKSVLTPEQYTQFLENFYTNAGVKKDGRNGKGFRDGKQAKHHKGGKGNFHAKADKSAKANKNAKADKSAKANKKS